MLTIVVPVYNEHENLPFLVEEIEKHVPQPFTIYIVYDFDEDSTVPLAKEMALTRPWLKVLKNAKGRGVGNAIVAGFEAVDSGPVLVVMADLSDDLAVVPGMLDCYKAGKRIVCASRYARGGSHLGGSMLKNLLSKMAGLSLKVLVGFPTSDATNNFRMYDTELVKGMLPIASVDSFAIALEITAKAFIGGVPMAEVPSHWRERVRGSSRFRILKWIPEYLRWYFLALLGGLRRRCGCSSL